MLGTDCLKDIVKIEKILWSSSDLRDKKYYSLNSHYIASVRDTGLVNIVICEEILIKCFLQELRQILGDLPFLHK
jgi:hypothetical protein